MITEQQILSTLDDYKFGDYCQFIELGHVYSYLIDSRLNLFKGDNDQWAIVAERMGFNPRAGYIMIEISYFGNCLINLESYNGQDTNYYTVSPIDHDSFLETTDGEMLKQDAKYWNVRGHRVELSQNKQDYLNAQIELREYEPDLIPVEAAGRLLIMKYGELFRATDEELYKSIPRELKKILVIDEWYHRDFVEFDMPEMTDEHLKYTYEFNKNLNRGEFPFDFDTFVAMYRRQEEENSEYNQKSYQDNRPSSYETWHLIANVIAKGDPGLYKPKRMSNSHWIYWPDSGSL